MIRITYPITPPPQPFGGGGGGGFGPPRISDPRNAFRTNNCLLLDPLIRLRSSTTSLGLGPGGLVRNSLGSWGGWPQTVPCQPFHGGGGGLGSRISCGTNLWPMSFKKMFGKERLA